MRRFLAALGLAAIVGFSTRAHADARTELEKVRAAYVARNWAEAEARVQALVDPKTGTKERALLSQARMYYGAILLAEGKRDDASHQFEELIIGDPSFDADPLSFPSDVINTFIDVRSRLNERLKDQVRIAARLEAERKAREEAEREQQRRWLEKVKLQASEERITVRNDRKIAFLPFGIGQFQNGQPLLGWVFLGVESSAVVATGITWGMYVYARGREKDEQDSGDLERKAQQYHARQSDLRTANLAFAGGFLAVAAAGIVQANLAFVPEFVEIKKRELPPVARIRPILTPLPGGGYVGVTGVAF